MCSQFQSFKVPVEIKLAVELCMIVHDLSARIDLRTIIIAHSRVFAEEKLDTVTAPNRSLGLFIIIYIGYFIQEI